MSRFRRAVPFLAETTGALLLVRMRDEGRAWPMAIGITGQLLRLTPQGNRTRVRQMIRCLCHSRRYIEAVMADGAIRWNADGTPAGPVTRTERDHAAETYARLAVHHAKKGAPGPTGPVPRPAVHTRGVADSQQSFPDASPTSAKGGDSPAASEGDPPNNLAGAAPTCGAGRISGEPNSETDRSGGGELAGLTPRAAVCVDPVHAQQHAEGSFQDVGIFVPERGHVLRG